MTANPPHSQKRPALWYGWVILAVVFIVMAIMVGIRNSLGFFLRPLPANLGGPAHRRQVLIP
jgi:hypothetical protein